MSPRRFAQGETVDFIIVGSGAAGGVIAKELAESGFTVLVLEQGPYLRAHEFEHDEYKYWFRSALNNGPLESPQKFRPTPRDEWRDQLAIGYHRLVGGGSVMFTSNYWRFKPSDFKERTLLGSIEGTGFDDWPITYEELEPYYTKAEWELGISGEPGAFDPPRSRPYPTPPLPVKSSGVLFERGARALGLTPQAAPMCIISQPYDGRPACQHCGYCSGFGCEHRAKSSTLFTTIPKAEATGRCEIRSGSYVRKIELSASGRATGVLYFDAAKMEHFQPARAVIVCANGGETPRLLLNSKSNQFPDGLANSSGLVGKYLMFNGNHSTTGVFEKPLNDWKSVMVTRMIWDYYDADPGRGFYGGGGIDARFWGYPLLFPLGGLAPDAPTWGQGFKDALRHGYSRTMNADCHTTSLPVAANGVELDPELKDLWGVPAMRVTYRDHDDDLAMMEFLGRIAIEILEAAGAERAWRPEVQPQQFGVHLLGTCRMGNDAGTSVVDRYHRTHDVTNLFLCDGSSFVTSGRGQPTATIQALAFRAADHIARFARRGEI
ncbi:MAG TPA: GMC family oxidoreductase [Gemmatimonadales bacterium]|jgi:choline dehydrogenase-like flavoprotein